MAKNGPKTSYDYRQSSIHTHSIPIQITEEMLRNLRARARKWVFRPFWPPFWPILRPLLNPSWPNMPTFPVQMISLSEHTCFQGSQNVSKTMNFMKSHEIWQILGYPKITHFTRIDYFYKFIGIPWSACHHMTPKWPQKWVIYDRKIQVLYR